MVKFMPLLVLASLLSFTMADDDYTDYKVVCYFTNWAQYRQKHGKYIPSDIDPALCTHAIFAFAKVTDNTIVKYEWNDEAIGDGPGRYAEFNKLKEKNPKLKTLLAVGGWGHASFGFTEMVATQSNRTIFIKNAIEFLKKWKFDGLDLDWEYPAQRGSPPKDKYRFVYLCKELREAFDQQTPPLLVTAAVAAGKNVIEAAYDIPSIAKTLHYIFLMSYDLYESTNRTIHHSALYGRPDQTGNDKYLNVDTAVNLFLKGISIAGESSRKLILGLAMYGRGFTLASLNTGIGAPANGTSPMGPITLARGFMSYYEICDLIGNKTTRRYFDEVQKVPYIVTGKYWIGYDDLESLDYKINYIKKKKLGGGMIWSLGMDDFSGSRCKQGKYPLLTKISRLLLIEKQNTAFIVQPAILLTLTLQSFFFILTR